MSRLEDLQTAEEVLQEQLKDEEFRKLWEAMAPARVIALRLVQFRVDHGLSQSALGRLLGMSQPAVARLESGEHLPTLPTLTRIAHALDIEILVDIKPSPEAESWVSDEAEHDARVAERVRLTSGAEVLIAAR